MHMFFVLILRIYGGVTRGCGSELSICSTPFGLNVKDRPSPFLFSALPQVSCRLRHNPSTPNIILFPSLNHQKTFIPLCTGRRNGAGIAKYCAIRRLAFIQVTHSGLCYLEMYYIVL